MSSFMKNPGPFNFTLERKDGTKFVGICHAISISQSYSTYGGQKTSVSFTGDQIRELPKLKMAKKKSKKLPKRKKK